MNTVRFIILVLYFPAAVGLLGRSVASSLLPNRLVSLSLALFCIELARMAAVDLCNLSAVSQENSQPELNRFRIVVVSTIVLELLGFYIALFYVAVGAAVVVFSQLWFNGAVSVQLWPGLTPEITAFKVQQRIPVLVFNASALLLLSLWVIPAFQFWLSLGLLLLAVLFLIVKYCVPGAQPQHPSSQDSTQSTP